MTTCPLVCWGCAVTKCHHLGGFNSRNLIISDLEPASLRSRCGQGLVPPEAGREGRVCYRPRLLAWWWRCFPCDFTTSTHCALCVQIYFVLEGHQSCWVGGDSNDLILTWFICSNPNWKSGHCII